MIDKNTQEKIEFSGIIRSVQPRSNVWRYRLDNRTHSMTGYNLFLSGTAEGEEGNFAVAISEKQMLKHRFHIGDEVRGTAWTKMYPKLDSRSWKGKCFTCKWACMANVAIEYNWGVTQKFRFESFCYGPKNCKQYKMGKPMAVPYKDCGSVYDKGWLDEICTENRDDEE